MKYLIQKIGKRSCRPFWAYDRCPFPRNIAEELIKAQSILAPNFTWRMVVGDQYQPISQKNVEKMKIPFSSVELHLSPYTRNWTRRFGRKVKAAGGTYSSLRKSGSECRFVTLPVHQADLIWEIVRAETDSKPQAKVVMIARGLNLPGWTSLGAAWISVHEYTWPSMPGPVLWLTAKVWSCIGTAISQDQAKPVKAKTPAEEVDKCIAEFKAANQALRDANKKLAIALSPRYEALTKAKDIKGVYDLLDELPSAFRETRRMYEWLMKNDPDFKAP
jgi:hypothetical protein